MIKTKKGQVILLDVLFTIVIVIFMFFMLLKFVETDTYKSNINNRTEELTSIGSLAYQKFINNPEINCKVLSAGAYVPGTIDTTTTITKTMLGIPSDYNFNVTSTGTINCSGCFTVPSTGNIYAINFDLVTCNRNMSKANYINYINSGGASTSQINLSVWRAKE
jgi:hypothetical protein